VPGLRALTLHVSACRWCRRFARQRTASGGVEVTNDVAMALNSRFDSQSTRRTKRPVAFALPAADAWYVEHLTRNFTSPSVSRSQNRHGEVSSTVHDAACTKARCFTRLTRPSRRLPSVLEAVPPFITGTVQSASALAALSCESRKLPAKCLRFAACRNRTYPCPGPRAISSFS
jgi:hypothetical protein